mmetsp:Transcript_59809/g.135325  ORF Transcript_59809/g.135325 Transcript_59809/m.135325 type:complete len:245 (-) Transcript_59809:197-931(-)
MGPGRHQRVELRLPIYLLSTGGRLPRYCCCFRRERDRRHSRRGVHPRGRRRGHAPVRVQPRPQRPVHARLPPRARAQVPRGRVPLLPAFLQQGGRRRRARVPRGLALAFRVLAYLGRAALPLRECTDQVPAAGLAQEDPALNHRQPQAHLERIHADHPLPLRLRGGRPPGLRVERGGGGQAQLPKLPGGPLDDLRPVHGRWVVDGDVQVHGERRGWERLLLRAPGADGPLRAYHARARDRAHHL